MSWMGSRNVAISSYRTSAVWRHHLTGIYRVHQWVYRVWLWLQQPLLLLHPRALHILWVWIQHKRVDFTAPGASYVDLKATGRWKTLTDNKLPVGLEWLYEFNSVNIAIFCSPFVVSLRHPFKRPCKLCWTFFFFFLHRWVLMLLNTESKLNLIFWCLKLKNWITPDHFTGWVRRNSSSFF